MYKKDFSLTETKQKICVLNTTFEHRLTGAGGGTTAGIEVSLSPPFPPTFPRCITAWEKGGRANESTCAINTDIWPQDECMTGR